jgi:hypothetical protein
MLQCWYMLQEMVCYTLNLQKYSIQKKKWTFIKKKKKILHTFITKEEETHINTTANKAITPAKYLLLGWFCGSAITKNYNTPIIFLCESKEKSTSYLKSLL